MEFNYRILKRNGDDYWRYEIRYRDPISGKPTRHRKRAGKTKATAQSAVLERIKSIEKIAAAKAKHGEQLTTPFNIYAMEWLEQISNMVEEQTYDQYRRGIVRFAIPVLKDKPFCEVTKKDIYAVSDLVSKTINVTSGSGGGKSKNNMMTGLKRMFNAAFKRGLIENNPAAGVEKFPEDPTNVDPLSIPEILSFLAAVDPFYHDYFSLALTRGPRHCEMIPLRWKHIDFETRQILIRVSYKVMTGEEGKPKTKGSIRELDMDDQIVDMLKKRKGNSVEEDYVFTDRDGNQLKPNVLRKVWYETLEKAGLRRRVLMHTRHTFASVAISSGEDVYWVMRTMGHTTLKMIHEKYGRWIRNRRRIDGIILRNALSNTAVNTTTVCQ